MKVALIDKGINYKTFIQGLKTDVYPIYIEEDATFATLLAKITDLHQPITNVVIAHRRLLLTNNHFM